VTSPVRSCRLIWDLPLIFKVFHHSNFLLFTFDQPIIFMVLTRGNWVLVRRQNPAVLHNSNILRNLITICRAMLPIQMMFSAILSGSELALWFASPLSRQQISTKPCSHPLHHLQISGHAKQQPSYVLLYWTTRLEDDHGTGAPMMLHRRGDMLPLDVPGKHAGLIVSFTSICSRWCLCP